MTKILLIEDEAMLRNEVAEMLGYEGYEVSTAEDGLVGLEYACRDLPDLIISDITMPRLDGYGLLLEMRSNLATSHIPFILVTARASHEDIRQGITLGADDYITKPFTRVELLQAIQVRLERKAAQERAFAQHIERLQNALTQEHDQRLLKAKLVAMFSHDFRNQIAVIQSSNSLLRDYADRLDEKRQLAHRNGIEAAAHLLMQMLDDMLIIAEMESGHLTLEEKSLNIERFVADIIAEFEVVDGGQHNLRFESSFHDNAPLDRRLLRQIAANLISNAIKYSPHSSEILILLDKQEGQCILSVQDQGIGITEPDQLRLFSAFQRGNNVRGVSGTGLGLAIVKQAVDLLQGAIQLESQLDVGTTVVVTFPCAPFRDN
jgi:two-component system, sensor histidine kinase and response regulator